MGTGMNQQPVMRVLDQVPAQRGGNAGGTAGVCSAFASKCDTLVPEDESFLFLTGNKMVTKNELIQWLSESHQNIEQLVSRLDRKQQIYPGWTIREILAHFTGWDDAVIASLRSHAAGGVPTVVAERGPNVYNAATVTEREALNFEHIYQEWQHTHAQLKIAIRELPSEKMDETIVFPWGQKGTIEDLVIGLTTEHESVHARDIQALLKE
jgi:hypothetical protein